MTENSEETSRHRSAAAIRLYGNKFSGHAWKVRQALVLLRIPHEYAYVDLLKSRAERRPDFVALAPFGEVPVLVAHDRVYAQSNAILLHLSRETGRLAGDDLDMLERWLFWEANRIGFSVSNLRFEKRFVAAPDAGVLAMLRRRCELDLDVLQSHLAARDFICGATLTMADLSCSAYLNFAAEAELDLSRWPAVARWLRAVSMTDGWEHPYELMDERRAIPGDES